MTSRNDITGDKIQTKPTTKEYSDNWDRIFGGCKKTSEEDLEVQINNDECCGKYCGPEFGPLTKELLKTKIKGTK